MSFGILVLSNLYLRIIADIPTTASMVIAAIIPALFLLGG